jgi:hypothetical protein
MKNHAEKRPTRQRRGADCTGDPCREKGNLNMSKYWRPLTQEEMAGLSGGDSVVVRQNYLYNPERLLVTYEEAKCVERSKRATTLVLKGSDTVISVGLTEVGCFQDDGWKMSPEEWGKIRRGDPVLVLSGFW